MRRFANACRFCSTWYLTALIEGLDFE